MYGYRYVLLRWTGSSFLRQHRGEVRVPERIARGCCVEKTSCRPRIGQVFHDLRTLSAWVFQPRDKIGGEFDFSTQLDDVKLVARSAAGWWVLVSLCLTFCRLTQAILVVVFLRIHQGGTGRPLQHWVMWGPSLLVSYVCSRWQSWGLSHRSLSSSRFGIVPLTNACRAARQQAHHLISFHLRGGDHFGLEQLAISYSRPKSALFSVHITLNNFLLLKSSGVPLGDQEYEYSNSLHQWPSDNFEGRSSTK